MSMENSSYQIVRIARPRTTLVLTFAPINSDVYLHLALLAYAGRPAGGGRATTSLSWHLQHDTLWTVALPGLGDGPRVALAATAKRGVCLWKQCQ